MTDYGDRIVHLDDDPDNYDIDNLLFVAAENSSALTLTAESTARVSTLFTGAELRASFVRGFVACNAPEPPMFGQEPAMLRAFRLGQKIGWAMQGEIALDPDLNPLLDLFGCVS